VVSGLCITLTSAVFVGSLSLFFSIAQRHSHQVVMTVFGWCFILWVGLAGVLAALVYAGYITSAQSGAISALTNPPLVMQRQTVAMLMGQTAAPWGWHCLIMLATAGVIMLFSVWRLRRAKLYAIGADRPRQGARHWPWRRGIRRVKGAPVVWKELSRPYLPRNRRQFWSLILLTLAIGAIVISLIVLVALGLVPLGVLAGGLISLLWLLFVINTTSASASSITREKEARTWPILLTTPLDDGQIVRGKAMGVLFRNLRLLAPLPVLGVLLLLSASTNTRGSGGGGMLIVVILGSVIRAVGAVVFLIGMALYMGTRVRTTTVAVVTTFGVYLASRMVLSIGTAIMMAVSGGAVGIAVMPIAGLFQAFVYVLVGLAALSGAMRRVRRDVFA
jgi:hypothetical protein